MKVAMPAAAVAVFVLLTACSANGQKTRANESFSASVPASATASDPATPPAAASSTVPNPPAAQPTRTGDPAAPGPRVAPYPTTTNGVDPNQPHDLAGGPTTLTGAVTTTGSCPILDTGSQRWALLGDMAKQLRNGSRVTVRGRQAAVPAGCGTDRALQVALVS